MQVVSYVNGMGLLSIVLLFLLILFFLVGIIRNLGRTRNLSLFGFLISIFALIGWVVVTLIRMGIASITDWIQWGRYVDFGVRGIWAFLLLMYVVVWAFPDYFNERKWALIVALILPLIYEVLMFVAFSDLAFINAFLASDVILIVIYMAIIPLYATVNYIRQDRIRGTPRVKWIWVTLLGLMFWFIGELVLGVSMWFQLPGYDSYFSTLGVTIMVTHTIGWIVLLIGFVFQERSIQSSAS